MIGWVFAILGAIAGGAVMGGVTFASMKAHEAVAVSRAVKIARDDGVRACNVRVGEIERVQNTAVDQSVTEAVGAANTVGPTPEDLAELKALCKASASCRSRGSL